MSKSIDELFPLKTLAEFHAENQQIVRDFGFMGDETTPVVIDPNKTKMIIRHYLVHAHDLDGKCWKNRFGVFCG